MKTKLTITVDRELVPHAKRYASQQGVSLSSVIENALRELVGSGSPSFADRWRGRFVSADRVDERYRALMDKYE
jgi:Family of unknown function (DUF6364)